MSGHEIVARQQEERKGIPMNARIGSHRLA